MREHKHFAARLAVVLTASLLVGASAFSDSRPSRETWRVRPYRGGYHVWRFPHENERRPSARDLRGTVASVDARRNTFVIHDANGNFITVVRRDRRIEPRPGDYVSISGPWNRRTGLLEGYSIRLLE